MHPLPGGRVLLAGHSGAAVITFDPTVSAPAQQPRTTAPNLLPPDGMWVPPLQTDTDLTRYCYGGVVRADRERLGGAAERQDVAHVLCAVADTGVGMPEDVLQRAAEPFFTTKGPQRAGLGLSSALGIMRQMGGRLDVRSEVDVGTRVTIRLQAYVS